MRATRREFLGLMAAAGSFLEVKPLYAATRGVPILQGMTDETSAQFAIVLSKDIPWKFEILRADGVNPQAVVTGEMVSRGFHAFGVQKLTVEGLELGVEYVLRVIDGGGRVADERSFRTLDLSPRPTRVALVSCALDLMHSEDVWRQLDRQDPELLFFIGDNVYCDRTSFISKKPADEKQLWDRYVLTRQRVSFYFQKRLRPVLATWDDHDYGTDNGDRTYRERENSKATFESFFAQSPRPSLVAGPGIARKFTGLGADVFFLDGRYFRDPPRTANAMMFGAEQEEWMFGNLSASTPAWLISGSLFYGDYQSGESFAGTYASNFGAFTARLKSSDAVVGFVSGDVHWSEVMEIEAEHQLNYPTFEIVSSSMHSYTFPGHEHRFNNPRRRASTSSHNFVMFEGWLGNGPRIEGKVSSFSASGIEFATSVVAAK